MGHFVPASNSSPSLRILAVTPRGPRVRLSILTGSVQVSHFLKAKLLENKGEPFRFPVTTGAVQSFGVTRKKPATAGLLFRVTPRGIVSTLIAHKNISPSLHISASRLARPVVLNWYPCSLSIPRGVDKKYNQLMLPHQPHYFCDPTGNRTPITALKRPCPNR